MPPTHRLALPTVAGLALTLQVATATAQTRVFACGEDRAVTVTATGPDSISVSPVEGVPLRLRSTAGNPLRFNSGEYRVTITPDRSRITVEIPDFGSVACTYRPDLAASGRPGIGNTDPCGPGFRQAPETDRCDPLPGNVQRQRQLPSATPGEGRLPMEGRSFGGIVRSGPGLAAARVASLAEGQTVTILERAQAMDGYDWFKIRFRGRTGYQWGGLMCSQNPLGGVLAQCDP